MLPSPVGRLAVFILVAVFTPPVLSNVCPRPPESAVRRPWSGGVKPVRLERSRGSYYVKTEVGSPEQVLGLQLRNDAGAITYVPSSNASPCLSGKCTMGARES